ncbi:MAG: hypothetical protein QXG00_08655 [Candidatus Woesearchaeota archaeon]
MPKKKQTKWGSIFITIFISLIMILSIFAIIIGNDRNTNNKYNNFKFNIGYFPDTTIPYYETRINKQNILFYNFPTEVENINISQNIINLLKDSQFIITTFDPRQNTTDLQNIDLITFDLQKYLEKPIVRAVITEDKQYSLPVIDCSNATLVTPVLYFRINLETKITQEGYCVVINAERNDLGRIRDILLYRYYGVISG